MTPPSVYELTTWPQVGFVFREDHIVFSERLRGFALNQRLPHKFGMRSGSEKKNDIGFGDEHWRRKIVENKDNRARPGGCPFEIRIKRKDANSPWKVVKAHLTHDQACIDAREERYEVFDLDLPGLGAMLTDYDLPPIPSTPPPPDRTKKGKHRRRHGQAKLITKEEKPQPSPPSSRPKSRSKSKKLAEEAPGFLASGEGDTETKPILIDSDNEDDDSEQESNPVNNSALASQKVGADDDDDESMNGDEDGNSTSSGSTMDLSPANGSSQSPNVPLIQISNAASGSKQPSDKPQSSSSTNANRWKAPDPPKAPGDQSVKKRYGPADSDFSSSSSSSSSSSEPSSSDDDDDETTGDDESVIRRLVASNSNRRKRPTTLANNTPSSSRPVVNPFPQNRNQIPSEATSTSTSTTTTIAVEPLPPTSTGPATSNSTSNSISEGLLPLGTPSSSFALPPPLGPRVWRRQIAKDNNNTPQGSSGAPSSDPNSLASPKEHSAIHNKTANPPLPLPPPPSSLPLPLPSSSRGGPSTRGGQLLSGVFSRPQSSAGSEATRQREHPHPTTGPSHHHQQEPPPLPPSSSPSVSRTLPLSPPRRAPFEGSSWRPDSTTSTSGARGTKRPRSSSSETLESGSHENKRLNSPPVNGNRRNSFLNHSRPPPPSASEQQRRRPPFAAASERHDPRNRPPPHSDTNTARHDDHHRGRGVGPGPAVVEKPFPLPPPSPPRRRHGGTSPHSHSDQPADDVSSRKSDRPAHLPDRPRRSEPSTSQSRRLRRPTSSSNQRHPPPPVRRVPSPSRPSQGQGHGSPSRSRHPPEQRRHPPSTSNQPGPSEGRLRSDEDRPTSSSTTQPRSSSSNRPVPSSTNNPPSPDQSHLSASEPEITEFVRPPSSANSNSNRQPQPQVRQAQSKTGRTKTELHKFLLEVHPDYGKYEEPLIELGIESGPLFLSSFILDDEQVAQEVLRRKIPIVPAVRIYKAAQKKSISLGLKRDGS